MTGPLGPLGILERNDQELQKLRYDRMRWEQECNRPWYIDRLPSRSSPNPLMEELMIENINLKALCLRNEDAINNLRNKVVDLGKKVEAMSIWEKDVYKLMAPMYSWFISHDLSFIQKIELTTVDQIELDRKADLEKKQQRKGTNDCRQSQA